MNLTKEAMNIYMRKRRRLKKKNGICILCNCKISKKSNTFCEFHRKERNEYQKIRYTKLTDNRE